MCCEGLVEEYSGLHSKCKEVKEQRSDAVRDRVSSYAVALGVAARHVLDKRVGVLEGWKGNVYVKDQGTEKSQLRHVLSTGTDMSRFKKKVLPGIGGAHL